MTEEQAEYKNPEMKDVLAMARKVMLRNALVKVKEGKSLTAKETELIEEASIEAEHGQDELVRGTVNEWQRREEEKGVRNEI